MTAKSFITLGPRREKPPLFSGLASPIPATGRPLFRPIPGRRKLGSDAFRRPDPGKGTTPVFRRRSRSRNRSVDGFIKFGAIGSFL
jgi:hypothetical protein